MSPVDLLRNKRAAQLRDDEALLLLLIGKMERRPHELRDESKLPERSFWRAYKFLVGQGWVEAMKLPSGSAGRGRVTMCRLTPSGIEKTALLMGLSTQGGVRRFDLQS